MKKYSVLIIEDHPFTAEAYKSAFKKVSSEDKKLKFSIEVTHDCDSANQKIDEGIKNKGIDIVFLDICLPPSKDGEFLSGEDLGIKIKKELPNTKIIVATTHYDNYRIHSIIKSINPDAFLVKNDINTESLVDAIKKTITLPPYYSITVLQSFRKQIVNKHIIDKIDREILFELSIGTKMKELPNIITMSMAGIEKRKRQLKEIFDVPKKEDRYLIQAAKKKGFI